MATLTIYRTAAPLSSRQVVRVEGTHDEPRLFSCPEEGGYVVHGRFNHGAQVHDRDTVMLQVFKGQGLAEVMAEYFSRNWDNVIIQDDPFKAGDRVDAGETAQDGQPILATVRVISPMGLATIDFDDGDVGTYHFHRLTPAK